MPTLDEVLRQISASDKPYYVYALCLSDGTPFYIGKGSAGRVAAHENEVNETAALTTKHEIIDHLKRSGQDVQYELLGLFELESDAFRYEVKMIAKYGRLDNGTGILTNRSNGGEGPSRQYGPG